MSQFLKSKILEYITRRILFNCGFSNVTSDGLYIYDRAPLQMINGKGAAHDADVLMNPPIQMPFTYPTRIIFECKAYSRNRKVGVDIVRNASGLRNDINDFEIITEDFLRHRQNNHRALLAISDRKRHYYQVGISTLFNFSKPALEFAANNKIPLLSISELFSGTGLADVIDAIPSNIESELGAENYNEIIEELSKKDINEVNLNLLSELFRLNPVLQRCLELINSEIINVYVGILESGEILFIKKETENNAIDILSNNEISTLSARIHWSSDNRERWWFEFNKSETHYYFYLPKEMAKAWKSFNDVRASALQIKAQNFARFFIFNKNENDGSIPFKLITLDLMWLQELIGRMEAES
jgi:hypothetical protein